MSIHPNALLAASLSAFVALFIAATSQPASAAVIASYDGSYVASSGTPPAGQTTWLIADTSAGGAITPNSPSAGLAHFNDPDGGRIAINDPLTDTPLTSGEYYYDLRMRIDSVDGSFSTTFAPLVVGARDEGTATGRTVMLGWNGNGQLGFYNNSTTLVQSINTSNFADGEFHDYRVVKFDDNGTFKVQAFVDGVAQFGTPILYTSLATNSDTGNGVGYFSSSPNRSDVTLDLFRLTSGSTVPEPASLVLLSMGLVGLSVLRKRRARA